MNKAIIGKKLGMTQVFLKDGTMVPVTVVKAGPCTVVQKKTVERDGYSSVQLGFEEVAEKKLNKPELGHLKAAGVQPLKILKEFDLSNTDSLEVGQVIGCDVFAADDFVDVTGTTKGRGFSGVIKLPGQYGVEQVTVLNLKVVKVDKEKGVLLIKGAIPGPKGSVVYVRDAVKKS